MKSRLQLLLLALLPFTAFNAKAQSVSSAQATIDKTVYSGLALSQNIPEKHLSMYWENYLDQFGKVKGRKGNYTIKKASLKRVSSGPVQVTSQVSAVNKNVSKVFLALNADGANVTSENDRAYGAAENLLKDFADYANSRDLVRVADEDFSSSEKQYQKLQREVEEDTKEIEKTEKKLSELRASVEKGNTDLRASLLDLQNKQRVLEAAKGKVPNIK